MALQHPELSAFVAVARLGSFTRAAAELNLSQPALSRRIRMIERALGGMLFDRLPEGARLTEAGRAFMPFAERALISLRDGDDAVRAVGNGDRGRISLAFASTFDSRGVTRAVDRFRRDNPGLELILYTGTSVEISDLVRRGDADLGLRYRADSDAALESRIIGEEVIEIICSPRHKLAKLKTVSPEQLAEETWIGYPYQRSVPDAGIKRMLLQYGLLSAHYMAVDSNELQIELTATNFGIGMLPRSTVAPALRAGRVRTLKVPAVRNVVPIALIRRKGAHQGPASKRLAAALIDAITKTKV